SLAMATGGVVFFLDRWAGGRQHTAVAAGPVGSGPAPCLTCCGGSGYEALLGDAPPAAGVGPSPLRPDAADPAGGRPPPDRRGLPAGRRPRQPGLARLGQGPLRRPPGHPRPRVPDPPPQALR